MYVIFCNTQWVFLWHTNRKFGHILHQVMLIQTIQICVMSALFIKLTVYQDIIWCTNLWMCEWKVEWWPCWLLWQKLFGMRKLTVEFNRVECCSTSTSETQIKICMQYVLERTNFSLTGNLYNRCKIIQKHICSDYWAIADSFLYKYAVVHCVFDKDCKKVL